MIKKELQIIRIAMVIVFILIYWMIEYNNNQERKELCNQTKDYYVCHSNY